MQPIEIVVGNTEALVPISMLARLIKEQLCKADLMNQDQRTACRIGVVSIAYAVSSELNNTEADAFMGACGL